MNARLEFYSSWEIAELAGKRQIKLGVSVRGVGYYPSAWRDPNVPADGGVNIRFYRQLAEIAERGLFDILFFADNVGITLNDVPKGVLGRAYSGSDFEPYTLCSALSQVTQNIGLVVTASTTFHHPYHLARLTLSLDHLSGGRAGWNVVTSSQDHESANFGQDKILEKGSRYDLAQEAFSVVKGLWESWDEDAFIRDKEACIYYDPAKMHVLKHEGEHFRVRGPLNLPRSPQGRPIVIQAGSSPRGIDLAAGIADIVYTAQNTVEDAKRFIAKVRDGLARHSRDERDVLIMPGILPIIGESRDHAQEIFAKMQADIDPMVGLGFLVNRFGDLSQYSLDEPVPADLRAEIGIVSRGEEMLRLARRNNWTLRQMYQNVSIGNAHKVVIGTAADVADVMEEWFAAGAADGFNVVPTKSPGSIVDFVDKVVPELQRRGLFRTAYESTTLRGNLGLPAV